MSSNTHLWCSVGPAEEGMSSVAVFFTVLFSMLGCIFLVIIGLVVYGQWKESRRKRFYWWRSWRKASRTLSSVLVSVEPIALGSETPPPTSRGQQSSTRTMTDITCDWSCLFIHLFSDCDVGFLYTQFIHLCLTPRSMMLFLQYWEKKNYWKWVRY